MLASSPMRLRIDTTCPEKSLIGAQAYFSDDSGPTAHSTQHCLYPQGLPGSGCRKNINSRSELLFRMPSPLNANSPQPPSPDNSGNSRTKIHRLIKASRLKSPGYGVFLITSKVLDARRRGATTEVYGGSNTPQACREPQGRTRGAIEGNAADDALMVDQGECNLLTYP